MLYLARGSSGERRSSRSRGRGSAVAGSTALWGAALWGVTASGAERWRRAEMGTVWRCRADVECVTVA